MRGHHEKKMHFPKLSFQKNLKNIMYRGVKILFFKKKSKIQKPKGPGIHGYSDANIVISISHRKQDQGNSCEKIKI